MKKALLAILLLLGSACGPRLGPPLIIPTTSPWTTGVRGLVHGPIATDGVRLFATTREGSLACLDLRTGRGSWIVEPGFGIVAARPGLLILREEDGDVLSISPENGEVLWRSATKIIGRIPPLIEGESVYVAGEGLAALDARTGATIWQAEDSSAISAPLATATGRLIVGEADGTLRCRDSATGRSLWTLATGGPLLAPAVADDSGSIYVGTTDRRILAVSVARGKIRWKWRIGADVDTGPVISGKSVLVGTHEGMLYALTRKTGDLRWRVTLPSRPLNTPQLLGSAVLVSCREYDTGLPRPQTDVARVQSDVVAFDVKTGRKIAVVKAPGELVASLLYGDHLFVSSRDVKEPGDPPVLIASIRLNVTIGPQLPAPSPAPKRH